jgi:hypothetical protein
LGSAWLGFALAVVVDVGMFAAILASRRDKAALWAVGGLAAVSWAANAQHALSVYIGGGIPTLADWAALDVVTLANALVVTAIAPVAALALAMLYHRSAGRVDAPAPATVPVRAAEATPAKPAPVVRKATPKPTAPPAARDWIPVAQAALDEGYTQADAARMAGRDQAAVSRALAKGQLRKPVGMAMSANGVQHG